MSVFDWFVYVLWLLYSPIVFFWLAVHPFTNFWRRRRGRTYVLMALGVWAAVDFFFLITRSFWLAGRTPRHLFPCLLGAALVAVEPLVIPHAESALGMAILIGRAEVDPESHPPRLVDTGLYARVRHPRYLSAMAMLFGSALLAGAPRLLLLAVLSVPLYYVVTALEERELVRRLGEPFRLYRRRVPRFIPRFRL